MSRIVHHREDGCAMPVAKLNGNAVICGHPEVSHMLSKKDGHPVCLACPSSLAWRHAYLHERDANGARA